MPKCKVIGVEPAAGDDATQSFKQKRLVTIAVPDTIADGARTPSLGEITFPLVMRYVDDMLTVTDDELAAMFFLWERMKIVVEPTGALAYAALHARKLQPSGRVGVVLSGGNVDLAQAGKSQNHDSHHRGGELQSSRGTMSATVQPARTARSAHPRSLKPSMPCSAKRRTPCTPCQRCNRARCRRACRALSIPG